MSEHGKIREPLALAAADARGRKAGYGACAVLYRLLERIVGLAADCERTPPQRALIPGTQVSPSFVDESRFCTRAGDNKSKPPAWLSLGLNRWQLAGEASRFPRREFSTALAESIYDNGLPCPQSPPG